MGNFRKYIIFALAMGVVALVSLRMAPKGWAQGEIQTRQYVLNDFVSKTMMVVMTPDELLNSEIKSSIQEIWHASPYEFCSREDFERLKKDDEYYFLTLSETHLPAGSTGVMSFSIFKGRDTASEGTKGLYKVCSMPFCKVGPCGENEILFLTPALYALQDNIERILRKALNFGYTVVPVQHPTLGHEDRMIVVDRSSLAFTMTPEQEASFAANGVIFTDDPANVVSGGLGSLNIAACHVISPNAATKGAMGFTMLFDMNTYELLYIKPRKVAKGAKDGLQLQELDAIAKAFIKKK